MDAGEIPNFLDHASLVQRESRPTIQLDDTGTAHALGNVLVRGADDHAFDTFVSSGRSGFGSARRPPRISPSARRQYQRL
jgi:hypothetical protein